MPKAIAINATMPEKVYAQILSGNKTFISHKKNSRINKYFRDKAPTIARIEETPDAWNIHLKSAV